MPQANELFLDELSLLAIAEAEARVLGEERCTDESADRQGGIVADPHIPLSEYRAGRQTHQHQRTRRPIRPRVRTHRHSTAPGDGSQTRFGCQTPRRRKRRAPRVGCLRVPCYGLPMRVRICCAVARWAATIGRTVLCSMVRSAACCASAIDASTSASVRVCAVTCCAM